MTGENPLFPFHIPAALYRWFLATHGVSAAARMAIESYKQLVVQQSAWYDVPTAALNVLEQGFIHHALLSLAAAEVINMVLGELFKDKVRRETRRETRDETNRAWLDWLRRKAEADAKGEPFNEPSPADQDALDKR